MELEHEVLKSEEDDSVNFIRNISDKEKIESRYVRRKDRYFSCYLSSQTGCKMGCKFCHLTTTKQTSATNLTEKQIIRQAQDVLDYARGQKTAREVYFDFMARGEPLKNMAVNDVLLSELGSLADVRGLISKFNISTILPKGSDLFRHFRWLYPTIYYSVYSMNPEFRKKWLPNAMDPIEAFSHLKDYQDVSKKIIKLHWAFIEGENDSLGDVLAIIRAADNWSLFYEINIVRYNPFSDFEGKESSKVEDLVKLLHRRGIRIKLVSRVGEDVYASCGMFVS